MNSAAYYCLERIQACFGRYERDEEIPEDVINDFVSFPVERQILIAKQLKAKHARAFLTKLPKNVMITLITALQKDKSETQSDREESQKTYASTETPLLGKKRSHEGDEVLKNVQGGDGPQPSTQVDSEHHEKNNARARSWFASRKRLLYSAPSSSGEDSHVPGVSLIEGFEEIERKRKWREFTLESASLDASTRGKIAPPSLTLQSRRILGDQLSWITTKWARIHCEFRPYIFYTSKDSVYTEPILVNRRSEDCDSEGFCRHKLIHDLCDSSHQRRESDLTVLGSEPKNLLPEETQADFELPGLSKFGSKTSLRNALNLTGVPIRLIKPYFPYRISLEEQKAAEAREGNHKSIESSTFPVWAQSMIQFDCIHGVQARIYLSPKLKSLVGLNSKEDYYTSSSTLVTMPMRVQSQLIDIWKSIMRIVSQSREKKVPHKADFDHNINVKINESLQNIEQFDLNTPGFQLGLVLNQKQEEDLKKEEESMDTSNNVKIADSDESDGTQGLMSLVYPTNFTFSMRPSVKMWCGVKSSPNRSSQKKNQVPIMTAFDAFTLVTDIARLMFTCGCHPVRPATAMVMTEIFAQRHANMLIRESLQGEIGSTSNAEARRLENHSGSLSPLELFRFLDKMNSKKKKGTSSTQMSREADGRDLLRVLGSHKAGISEQNGDYLNLAVKAVEAWERHNETLQMRNQMSMADGVTHMESVSSSFISGSMLPMSMSNFGSKYELIKTRKRSLSSGIWPSLQWLVRSYPIEFKTFMHWNILHMMAKKEERKKQQMAKEKQLQLMQQRDSKYVQKKPLKQMDEACLEYTDSTNGMHGLKVIPSKETEGSNTAKKEELEGVKKEYIQEEEVDLNSDADGKFQVKEETLNGGEANLKYEYKEGNLQKSNGSQNEICNDRGTPSESEVEEDMVEEEDIDDSSYEEEDEVDEEDLEDDIDTEDNLATLGDNGDESNIDEVEKENKVVLEKLLSTAEDVTLRSKIAWALTRGLDHEEINMIDREVQNEKSYNPRLPRLVRLEQSLSRAEYQQYCDCRTSAGDLVQFVKSMNKMSFSSGLVYIIAFCMRRSIRNVLLRASMMSSNEQIGFARISDKAGRDDEHQDKSDVKASTTASNSESNEDSSVASYFSAMSNIGMFRLSVSLAVLDEVIAAASIIRRSATYHRLAHEYFALAYTHIGESHGKHAEDDTVVQKENLIRIWINATRKSMSSDTSLPSLFSSTPHTSDVDSAPSSFVDLDIPSLVFANVLLDTQCFV